MSDRYQAQTLPVQHVYSMIDKTLVQAGIPFNSLEAYYQDQPLPALNLDLVTSADTAQAILLGIPAALTVSFIPESHRMTLLAACRQLVHTWPLPNLQEAGNAQVRTLLTEQDPVFFGFYAEAGRMLQTPLTDDDESVLYSDNLILEVADLLIGALPIGPIVVEMDSLQASLFQLVAIKAVEIRAQISWGMVSDFEAFRQDILLLSFYLTNLEEQLGVEHSMTLDFSQLDERTQLLLRQPMLIQKLSEKA